MKTPWRCCKVKSLAVLQHLWSRMGIFLKRKRKGHCKPRQLLITVSHTRAVFVRMCVCACVCVWLTACLSPAVLLLMSCSNRLTARNCDGNLSDALLEKSQLRGNWISEPTCSKKRSILNTELLHKNQTELLSDMQLKTWNGGTGKDKISNGEKVSVELLWLRLTLSEEFKAPVVLPHRGVYMLES